MTKTKKEKIRIWDFLNGVSAGLLSSSTVGFIAIYVKARYDLILVPTCLVLCGLPMFIISYIKWREESKED